MATPSSEILAWNERIKALSGMFFNLAAGLVAGSAAKIYTDGAVVPETLLWMIGVAALLFVGWRILHYIEVEI